MKHKKKAVIFLIVGLMTGIILFSYSTSFTYQSIHGENNSGYSLKEILSYEEYTHTSEAKPDYVHRWAQHPFLTRSAIKLFEDYKGRNVFTDEKEKLIIRGSIEEDTDVPPSLAMKDDNSDLPPFVDDPEHYLITASFDIEIKDLRSWYDHQRCLNHFDPAILQEVLDGSEPRSATDFAQSFKKLGLGDVAANHFAWENIKLVDEKLQLIMLGHVLHLLEDIGCPPHVREDKHGGDFLTKESSYEIFLGEIFSGIEYTTPYSARIRANNQIEEIEGIEEKDPLTKYFESLRDLTQKGYFSKNTMFSKNFIQNFTDDEVINDENGDYIYKYNIGGTKLAYKGDAFDRSYKRWLNYYNWLLYLNLFDGDPEKEAFNKAKDKTIITQSVAKDYFNELEIPIIKHCAGVINLFYKTFMFPVGSNITTDGVGTGDGGTGDITITYDLESNDSCSITVEYQGGSVGTTWTPATTTGETSGIIPGTGKIIIWHSAIDENGCSASDYKIKIVPHDGIDVGTAGISSAFTVNNQIDPLDIDNDGDGYTENNGDCDDTNPAINPDAEEICNDEIDNNCNDEIDEGCVNPAPCQIPDTGQTQSYTDTFGEDSDYTINPHSYTKLDAQGNSLPDDATSWDMVKDNVTGLIWQKETAEQRMTWEEAISYCENLTLGGHTDWRLPTIKELSFIVDSGRDNPSINTDYFDCMRSLYWTATTYATNNDFAWEVYFTCGTVYCYHKSSNFFYVRAVRGEQSGFDDFEDNGDGTVTDTTTGLMWQKATEKETMSWEDAISYCENLTLGGHTDWRLPNRNELQSLVDYTCINPSIDTITFPDTMSWYYWTATTFDRYNDCAWRVFFRHGQTEGASNKSSYYYVRAVREGQ